MTTVRTDRLSVWYGRHQILHEVCFKAEPGAVTAIVGPNGCGKTTLLRAMTGELPFQGEAMLNDTPVRGAAPQDLARMRAVLPQAIVLAFPFTVLEVVRLGLTAGLATDDPGATAALPLRALDRVGLAGFEARAYQDLSGGEKQRVQLARVLVQVWQPVLDGVPRWLFLDEPVSALDIGHQLMIMQIARSFADAGGGVVAVMHDLNLTAMFAQRVTLMHRGQILRAGSATQVLTDDALSEAYGCHIATGQVPEPDMPWVLPQTARLARVGSLY